MTIKTIKSSGGDYSSLSAWEAAQLAVLLAPAEAECYSFSSTDNFAFSGIITSASNYLRVYAAAGNRLDGRSRAVSGVGFRITDSGNGTVRFGGDANHVRFDGIEIEQTGSAEALAIAQNLSSGSDIRFENCIIHGTRTGTSYTILAIAANLNLTLRNNIVYGSERTWDTRGATSVVSENNTFWRHADQLGLVSGSELSCKNSYSGKSGSSDDYWSGGSPTGNNNASSDTSATARFTSSVNSAVGSSVFTSVTSGSEDFTLKSGTNALVDVGATLSVATDIIGTVRPQGASWDVGASERIVSGGGGTAAPSGISSTASVGTATAKGNAAAAPAGVTTAASVGTAISTGTGTALPSGVGATSSIGTATATGSGAGNAVATGVSTTAVVGTATAVGAANIAVTGTSSTAAIGTAVASDTANAVPTGTSVSSTVGVAVGTGNANVSATGISATSAIGAATASAGTNATTSPASVSAATSVGSASSIGAATANPGGVSVLASIGTAIASGQIDISAYPAGVLATAYVGQAIASDGTVTVPYAMPFYFRSCSDSHYIITQQENAYTLTSVSTQYTR